MVGAIGTVLGIDRNAFLNREGSPPCHGLGLSNVRFKVSELETFDNEGRRYDALIGGAGLSARSCGDVATISKLSGPGGVIAFQEIWIRFRSFLPLNCSFEFPRGSLLVSRRVVQHQRALLLGALDWHKAH